RCRLCVEMLGNRLRITQGCQRYQLTTRIIEYLLCGDLLWLLRLDLPQQTTNYLQHVVDQQTEGTLEYDRLGSTADEAFQRKHLGDLLKYSLDLPAQQVGIEQIRPGKHFSVEQVGHEDDRFFARSLQGDLADIT